MKPYLSRQRGEVENALRVGARRVILNLAVPARIVKTGLVDNCDVCPWEVGGIRLRVISYKFFVVDVTNRTYKTS